jgi:hypothetical protein
LIPLKIPDLRWIIALMLFLATSINYAYRLALSVVSSDLRKEFAMTEQEYSYVVTGMLATLGTGWVVQHSSYTPVFLLAGLLHPLSAGLVYWLCRIATSTESRSLPLDTRCERPENWFLSSCRSVNCPA